MTEIKLIFRFHIDEFFFKSIEQSIVSDKHLNIITSDKIRNEFLQGGSDLAKEINQILEEGILFPNEYRCPFWTALINEGQINIFTAMIGNVEQFKEFEKCMEINEHKLTEVYYLKVNNINELTEMAKLKYGKIYEQSEILKSHIEEYQKEKEEIIAYAECKYNIIIKDFFETEIKI